MEITVCLGAAEGPAVTQKMFGKVLCSTTQKSLHTPVESSGPKARGRTALNVYRYLCVEVNSRRRRVDMWPVVLTGGNKGVFIYSHPFSLIFK